jgi:hypothetical protein
MPHNIPLAKKEKKRCVKHSFSPTGAEEKQENKRNRENRTKQERQEKREKTHKRRTRKPSMKSSSAHVDSHSTTVPRNFVTIRFHYPPHSRTILFRLLGDRTRGRSHTLPLGSR